MRKRTLDKISGTHISEKRSSDNTHQTIEELYLKLNNDNTS